MNKFRFITPFVIFAAGFALSAAMDVRHLLSSAQGTLSNTAIAQTTQKPCTPQFWEYRVISKPADRKSDINDQLNPLGAQGFEIFSVTQSSENLASYVTIVLRRPK